MTPRDASIFFRFSGLALTHYTVGDFENAILWAARAIHRMPRRNLSHFLPRGAADHLGRGC
jgi:hypothetical protein